MKRYKLSLLAIVVLGTAAIFSGAVNVTDNRFVAYTAMPEEIGMFYKNGAGKNFGSLQNLRTTIESKNKKLHFAMNGGMYKPDHSPQGLYIENGRMLMPLDTAKGSGNFYLEPNGIFFITAENKAAICTTPKFSNDGMIKYATQSGPMLVIDGVMHPAFKKGSANLQVRKQWGYCRMAMYNLPCLKSQ